MGLGLAASAPSRTRRVLWWQLLREACCPQRPAEAAEAKAVRRERAGTLATAEAATAQATAAAAAAMVVSAAVAAAAWAAALATAARSLAAVAAVAAAAAALRLAILGAVWASRCYPLCGPVHTEAAATQ